MALPTPKLDLDVARLRSLLHYDPTTGAFTWRVARRNNVPAGHPVGHIGNRGYVKIRLDGRYWLAHRLAWAYVHGVLPIYQIDHINRIRHDNRIVNLRDVPQRQNVLNGSHMVSREKTSLGTTFVRRRQKWQAQICIQGQNIYLGGFDTQSEANAAYRKAAQERK